MTPSSSEFFSRCPFIRGSIVLLLLACLTGCIPTEIDGPASLFQDETFQKIDLALLLVPDLNVLDEVDGIKRNKKQRRQKRLQRAFTIFYEEQNDDMLKRRRNRVQDRIMAVSNKECAEFVREVRSTPEALDVSFGIISVFTAGVGSILPDAALVRWFSVTSGITSGIRAEIDKASLHKRTLDVLVRGFVERREDIQKNILEEQKKGIDVYSLERAIGDAIKYHDACNFLIGLEQVERDRNSDQKASDARSSKTLKPTAEPTGESNLDIE